MTASWRTVRVFISSTFKDMQAERDHLVRFVFPKLREELLHRSIHLVDVDLRWGVTSEQDSLQVCKEIIDECRPRFLCMLGGRYGWTPPGREESITAAEVRYGVLDRLGEHGYAFFYFRDPAATDSMVEAKPGEFREPPGSPNEQKLAELKSAITSAGLNSFVYPATWDGQTSRLTGLKVFGDRVYADLMRSIDEELGTQPPQKLDEFAEENAAMEAFVEERTERFVLGSRESVLNDLLAHASETGGNGYVCLIGAPGSGKSALLAHLCRCLQSPGSGLQPSLVIPHFVGASPGSTDIRRTLRRLCHEIYVGCGFEQDKQEKLTQITGNDEDTQKARQKVEAEYSIPDDPESLMQQLPRFLEKAGRKGQVVVLLDGISQFDLARNSAGLYWLPEDPPPNVRIILSALDGPALDELRRRYRPPREIELKPLTAADGEAIIEQFRQRYHKRFESDQRAVLLAKADAGTPLYLLAALEELRTLGTYEEITSRIAELPPDTQALFTWILKRLENDEDFRDPTDRKIGQCLVSRFASLLGASRYGLSPRELTDLLTPDDVQGNVAALLHLLRPYLMRRGELLDFYHGQFRAATENAYLESDTQRHTAHEQLAGYFRVQADPDQDGSWRSQAPRPFLELPFHLARANPDELTEILFDYRWLRSKLKATDSNVLMADYHLIDDDAQARLVQGAIRLSSHTLAQDHSHLPSQLFGRLLPHKGERVKALLNDMEASEHSLWLRTLVGTLTAPGGPLLRTLAGHKNAVNAVAVTPDGRYAISASDDKTLKVWELASGRTVHTLAGHRNVVNAVAVTPDGRYAVSGSDDKTLKVWELASGRPVHTLAGHGGCVNAVAITPDGRYVVSGSDDKTLKVWDLASGWAVHTLVGHKERVMVVAVTADGHYVVSRSGDYRLIVWELATGRTVQTSPGGVWGVTITPDGQYGVLGLFDDTLGIWELASGRVVHTLVGHKYTASAVAVTLDSQYAVSGALDGELRVWELASGRTVHTLEGHRHLVSTVVVTPDGRYAVSATDGDKTLQVWELASGREVQALEGHCGPVNTVAVTPDSRYAISASDDKTLKVWELASEGETHTVAGHENWVTAVAVTPDGRHAISGSFDATLKIWELASGRELHTLVGHKRSVSAVGVTPDGRYAISASEDKTLKVWELAGGRMIHTLGGHGYAVYAVVITQDGRYAVSACADKTLKVWELAGGRAVHTLAGYDPNPLARLALAVTADGRYVVARSEAGTLKVWELASGRVVRTLAGHKGDHMWAVAVTPDSRCAVSGSLCGELRVWELATGQEVYTLCGHKAQVNAVAVTPDGRYAISASDDRTLKIWELASGQAVHTLAGHEGPVHTVVVAADGRYAISGSDDGTLKVWETANGKAVTGFCVESAISCCTLAPDGRTIVVGEGSGRMHFLRLENVP